MTKPVKARGRLAGIAAIALTASLLAPPQSGAAPTGDDDVSAGAMTAPSATNNDQAPRSYFPADVGDISPTAVLPDLFTFFSSDADPDGSGRVETAAEWDARADELSDLIQYYLYGYQQPTPTEGSTFRAEVIDEQTHYFVDVVDHDAPGDTEVSFALSSLRIPVHGVDTDIEGPYPAVLVVGGLSEQQASTLLAEGYAYIGLNTGSVYSDNAERTGAYTQMYPYQAGVYEYDSGSLMGWAWGISRIIDAMFNDAEAANEYNLAWDQTAVTGVSRNGKAAVLAAAFDDRIRVAAPSDPGGAGLSGFRYTTEGQMFTYNTPPGQPGIYSRNETVSRSLWSSHWYSSMAQQFDHHHANYAPFDLHGLAALVSPRPFITWTGEEQQSWLNSPSTVLSLQAAQEAYALVGAEDELAWAVRDAAHANQDRDLPDLIAIMDREFDRSAELNRRHFDSLENEAGAARDNSGIIYPDATFSSISEMTRNPYEFESVYLPWARPGTSTLWSPTTFIAEGEAREVVFHSDAASVSLTLPSGSELVEPVADGQAVFELDATQAQTGRYVATTSDGTRTIELAGFSVSDALRHGLNLSSGSPEGMAVGFSSPITNLSPGGAGVHQFVDGEPLTSSIYDDGEHQAHLQRYGAALRMSGVPEGPWDGSIAFTYGVRNVQLQSLPGLTVGVDLELTKDQVPNWIGWLQDGITSPFGEAASWASDDLQNTPFSGNLHGRWPLAPNRVGDDGTRPASVQPQNDFAVEMGIADVTDLGFTMTFSEPMSANELGLALDVDALWTLEWAEDLSSVRVVFDEPGAQELSRIIVFRAVDAEANMIPGPVEFLIETTPSPEPTETADPPVTEEPSASPTPTVEPTATVEPTTSPTGKPSTPRPGMPNTGR